MLLYELMVNVLTVLKKLRSAGKMSYRPKNWGDIKRLSSEDMITYGCNVTELKRDVKLLTVQQLWKEDDKRFAKDKFAYLVIHQFDYKLPLVFMLRVDGFGIFLVDTAGADRIEHIIKIG